MSNSGGPGPWGSGGNSGGGQRPPGGGGPWGGGGPGGPFGGRPGGQGPIPDLDALIGRLQAYIRSLLGGRGGPRGRFTGGRGLALIGLAVVALWLASGIYRVQPDELGVVLRFGAFNRTTLPGLNYHLPWPVESALTPAVTRINRIEIGYRSGASSTQIDTGTRSSRNVLEESLMLTGDENIIDINFAVFWKVRSNGVGDFLFNIRSPESIVKAVAESSMREVIGRTPIQPALTELRAQIENDVLRQTQQILDNYNAGVEITQVQLQKVDPPAEVVESFLDVQRANTDAERLRNEAQAYANDIVPRARGDSARIVAEGQGAKQASVAQATGQTQRFLSVLAQYQQAKEVTLQRMYIETMQDILTHSPALVVDDRLKGLVPFLPLNLPNPAPPRPAAPPAAAAPAPGASR
ncbi:MAG TPA: FtsH protease activity modulator HflK [Acetobacteraceae bacterium]|jgi:membrane protease subunit HflK|nr:FtsH protease activity modulator HflK [Acetobacteraceae bacterium]